MIYESVNLKGVVYEPKQNSSSLQSVTTRTGFTKVGSIFYEVHLLSFKTSFNWMEQKTGSEFSVLKLVKDLLFSEDFYQRFDSQQVVQGTWQTGIANARLEFSGKARFQIFSQK